MDPFELARCKSAVGMYLPSCSLTGTRRTGCMSFTLLPSPGEGGAPSVPSDHLEVF